MFKIKALSLYCKTKTNKDMNENLNLIEILKDCPKGTKLYSPLFGEVEFQKVTDNSIFPITVSKDGDTYNFTLEGRVFIKYEGECLLFPSKYEQDWSKFKPNKHKFDPNTLQPYDKVLVRYTDTKPWTCAFYSHRTFIYNYTTADTAYVHCIPYNNDTKYLRGKAEEAPEYYRYWED